MAAGVRSELQAERACRQRLEEDFRYNLALLEQRDRELAGFETAMAEVKKVVGGLVAENSELRVQLDGARADVGLMALVGVRLHAYTVHCTLYESLQSHAVESHTVAAAARGFCSWLLQALYMYTHL